MSILSDLGTKVGAEFKSHRLRIEDLENGVNTVTSVNGQTGAVTVDEYTLPTDQGADKFLAGDGSYKNPMDYIGLVEVPYTGSDFNNTLSFNTSGTISNDIFGIDVTNISYDIHYASSYSIEILEVDGVTVRETLVTIPNAGSWTDTSESFSISQSSPFKIKFRALAPSGWDITNLVITQNGTSSIEFGQGDGTKFLSDDGQYKEVEIKGTGQVVTVSETFDSADGWTLDQSHSITNGVLNIPEFSTHSTKTYTGFTLGQDYTIKVTNNGASSSYSTYIFLGIPGSDYKYVPPVIFKVSDGYELTFTAVDETLVVNFQGGLGDTVVEGFTITTFGLVNIELAADGDGTKYLSDDGTYKLIESLENVMISGVSRSTTTTNGDNLTFDLSTTNNFTANISTGGTLTFSNLAVGQSGNIVLINSGVTIAKASNVKTTSDFLTTVGVAGTFWLSYICDGTNVYVTASTKLS